MSTENFLSLIKQASNVQGQHLHTLPVNLEQDILKDSQFPKDFRNLNFKSISALYLSIEDHTKINKKPRFVILNGIGNGLGDNYVGLGVLQRLLKLLAAFTPEFVLMQELEERIAPIYANESQISVRHCLMTLDEFLTFDFYIDFSKIDNMPSFDHIAAAHFNCFAFSVNYLLPKSDLKPKIVTDAIRTQQIKTIIDQEMLGSRQTVLVHPLASSPLRKMPSHLAAKLINALIADGFNVVSAFEYADPPEHFFSLAQQSQSLNDLVSIINAVDAVISVGTVVYHISSALGKPTLLLPTVNADIRSANLLSEVKAWTPDLNLPLYMNLHKSEDEKELQIAKQIWQNIDIQQLIKSFKAHVFECASTKSIKISVIVVCNGDAQEELANTLDGLIQQTEKL